MDSAKRNLAVNASNSKQHKKKLKATSIPSVNGAKKKRIKFFLITFLAKQNGMQKINASTSLIMATAGQCVMQKNISKEKTVIFGRFMEIGLAARFVLILLMNLSLRVLKKRSATVTMVGLKFLSQ